MFTSDLIVERYIMTVVAVKLFNKLLNIEIYILNHLLFEIYSYFIYSICFLPDNLKKYKK